MAELERLGLRVGTVHAFQGSEAHTVVAVLGLVDDDSPARVRFVSDPNLFNVLVTRARCAAAPAGWTRVVRPYAAVPSPMHRSTRQRPTG